MNTKKRELWIDIIKGIAIFFMIFGHVEYVPDKVKDFFAPFILAPFFLASGLTFSFNTPFKAFVVKKVRTLLWPWLFFASLNIILSQIITFSQHGTLLQEFAALFLQIRGKSDGLWFFPCLFLTLIVFYALASKIQDLKKLGILCSIFLALGLLYSNYVGIPLPWHFEVLGPSVFYVYLGYLLGKTRYMPDTKSLVICLIIYTFASTASVILYSDSSINYYYTDTFYIGYVLRYASLVPLIIGISRRINSRFPAFAGNNSMIYFALHGKPKRLITVILERMEVVGINPLVDVALGLFNVATVSLIMVIPCLIIRKYFPFLLGQPYPKCNDKTKAVSG